jgi:hypothetical protein
VSVHNTLYFKEKGDETDISHIKLQSSENTTIARKVSALNKKGIKRLEKIGRLIEKQFKKEIRKKFGQHMPKAFVTTLVNNRVHHALDMLLCGKFHENIHSQQVKLEHSHEILNELQVEFPYDDHEIVIDDVTVTISKRKHGGWKAIVQSADINQPRRKTIQTRLSTRSSWEMFKKKILIEVTERRLEHKHVHDAKKHAKRIVSGFTHSTLPIAIEGTIKGLENLSHSSKVLPKAGQSICGNFAVATILTGGLEINEAKKALQKAGKLSRAAKQISQIDNETDVKESGKALTTEFQTMEKQLRRQALGSLVIGSINVVEGASTLAYTTVVKTAALVAATSMVAVALGATSGGLAIAAGMTSGVIHANGIKKIRKQISQLNKFRDSDHFQNDQALLSDFIIMQKRMLNNKKLNKYINLSGDGMLIAGGALLTAALVTGVTTLGIGAGAIFGGALAGYGIAQGVKVYKNHEYKKEQKVLTREDAKHEEDVTHMKSDIGVLIRLAEKVESELDDKLNDKPFTDHVVRGYLGMDPVLFLKMMENVKFELCNGIMTRPGYDRVTTEVED